MFRRFSGRKMSPLGKCSKHVVVIRHAERLDAVEDDWKSVNPTKYGDYPPDDCPLSERGLQQARRISLQLAMFRPKAIFVSPYERCVTTIGPTTARLDFPMKIEPGLGEMLYAANYPPNYLNADGLFDRFGGEFKFDTRYTPMRKAFSLRPELTFDECDKRVWHVMKELTIAHECKGVVYVTHRHVCSAIVAMYLDCGQRIEFEPGMMAFLELTRKGWVIDYVVQT